MGNLEGLSLVLGGGTTEIGTAIASRFLDEGAQVAFIVAEDAGHPAPRPGCANAAHIAFEPGNRDSIREACVSIDDWRTGKLVVVIVGEPLAECDFPGLDLRRWCEAFARIVETPLLFTTGLMASMKADGWGRVVNIIDSLPQISGAFDPTGLTSQAGLVGLTRALASDLGPDGITVNAVKCRTDLPEPMEHSYAMQAGAQLLADSVGALVAYLATDQTGMLTAQTFVVGPARSPEQWAPRDRVG